MSTERATWETLRNKGAGYHYSVTENIREENLSLLMSYLSSSLELWKHVGCYCHKDHASQSMIKNGTPAEAPGGQSRRADLKPTPAPNT